MNQTINAFEHWMLNYRRVWPGTVFSGFAMRFFSWWASVLVWVLT